MKNLFFSVLAVFAVILFTTSCEDEDPVPAGFDYHIHINAPDTTDKHGGNLMHVHIDFEDHNGGIVHNVGYKIYRKDNPAIVAHEYEEHVHVEQEFSKHEDVLLANGQGQAFSEHADWVLEAEVYDHDGTSRVTEAVEFHVHPM